jgi:transcriptional regulator with XRE-family HTH domain
MSQKRKIAKQNLKLGKRIKKMRETSKMTQEELAEKVGVSLGWISKIERGIYPPSWKLLAKIARALGIKAHELIPF